MWKLTMISLPFVAVLIMSMIGGLPAQLITLNSDRYREDLTVRIEEPMDRCDQTNYGPKLVTIINGSLESIEYNYYGKKRIHHISLENIDILSIPQNVFNGFKNLHCLNIRRNPIKSIFDKFLPSFNHKSLAKLNLAYMVSKINYSQLDNEISIKYIPPIQNISLPNCTHLDISGNNLIDLPIYLESSFPNLTHLYMSDNKFNSRFFVQIPKTTRFLSIERNSKKIDVAYLPENISDLFLSDNVIINTEHFKKFKNLRTLSIRKCNDIYSIIDNIPQENIVNLDISENHLPSIDFMRFENFTSLKRFNLNRNNIVPLYFLTFLGSLINLSLERNHIIVILEFFFQSQINLRTLSLRGNHILAVHENAFVSFDVLEKLDLAENKLMKLHSEWMDWVSNLYYLNLELNEFRMIDDMHIQKDSNLSDLFVNNKFLIMINTKSFQNLPRHVRIHIASQHKCIYNE